MDDEVIRRRAIVRGRVQGVGFRYSARDVARRSGVAGWVRNRPDGTVEVHAEGPAAAVEQLLDWLASGPPGASVETVDVTESLPQGDSSFDIRR